MFDWPEKLVQVLIDAGTNGISQNDLARKRIAPMSDLLTELNALHEANKVQKFSVPQDGKQGVPKTIWRATVLLLPPQN